LLAFDHKHDVTGGRFRPDERNTGKHALETVAAAPDLHHQKAVGTEMCGRANHDPAHHIQAAAATGKRDPRFVPIFAGQARHR
jgi:hypothetical protein